jgi:glycosyltransferase involved in cell wall biosynthesis
MIMVGDGKLLDASHRLAAALGVADRITFPGALPHARVAELMRGARAFVQHSVVADDGDSEGTPVASLEAGATGLPSVVTAHAGLRDVVVDGETGYLVAEGDVDAMAARMIRLALEPDHAGALGRQARLHVRQHFSLEKSLGVLWQLLEGAMRPEISVEVSATALGSPSSVLSRASRR